MKKKILITGAAGSIGSQMTWPNQEFILVDRDEYGLFKLMNKFHERTDIHFELADVGDLVRMKRIISHYEPELVIHAAAYKQLPFLQKFPYEAYYNNSLTTKNLLELCEFLNVPEFIYISTDKAVNPVSHLGWSKRLGEIDVINFQGTIQKKIIRFGNVVHSRGAVQQSFEIQLKRQGFIELTDEQMKRYFLTSHQLENGIQELVRIKQSGLFVMKMGSPQLILDYAKEFLISKGYSIDAIKLIGVREGEKLQEELYYDFEKKNAEFNHFDSFESPSKLPDEARLRKKANYFLDN